MSVPTPLDVFGDLFVAVQEAALFPDSKTFADAVPLIDPMTVMDRWRVEAPLGEDALAKFVTAHFTVPQDIIRTIPPAPATAPLATRIRSIWPDLVREPVEPAPGSSELKLPRRYVVPGGRFRELYYWDSYFTMLGLKRAGRQDLVEDMIACFGSLLDRFGRIPNGTRTYYLSRSHPPVLYLMIGLGEETTVAARERQLRWLMTEHAFWMAGANDLAPGESAGRVVRLTDGSLLNRYWDDLDRPRDESWREDVALASSLPIDERPALWRNLRAAAESGWDFSTRWLADGTTLASIRTTRLVPIDLNCLVLGLEEAIAARAAALGHHAVSDAFQCRAAKRRSAIEAHLWDAEGNYYADFDLDLGACVGLPTAAMAFAMFSGVATPARAASTVLALRGLVADGGLLATRNHSGQQWDSPNGWAPLQWIAVAGLRQYGYTGQANDIARRWLSLVEHRYRTHGDFLEKYDVVAGDAGGGGEYAVQTGFGWTNGVVDSLLQ